MVLKSVHRIGPTEVGLVTKRSASGKLHDDNPIAFRGEAGYQAELLMPGLRFKLWPIFSVKKYPWVQVPAGEIGVVIAQVGEPLPIGAKSAVLPARVRQLLRRRARSSTAAAQKGVQRPVLPPGTLVPIHPVGVPRHHLPRGVRRARSSPELAALGRGRRAQPRVVRPRRPSSCSVVVIAPAGRRAT